MTIQTDSDGNPILSQRSEDGFVDLTFRIVDLTMDARNYNFRLLASHHQQVVGMNVVLFRGIQSGFDANMNVIRENAYSNGVRFMKSGQESDRLISAISELYGISTVPLKMVDSESFTAIALHQGEIDLDNDPVKIKLFGKDGDPFDEEAYYESFFNIDIANRLVFWNEKDQEYRDALVRALAVS